MKTVRKIERTCSPQLIRRRVAAYCRVSTDSEEQHESLESQKTHYEKYISTNPEWSLVGITLFRHGGQQQIRTAESAFGLQSEKNRSDPAEVHQPSGEEHRGQS